MADVQPFRALHYDLARTGGLQPVAAPPYDVIDADQRAALVARSPYNVVEIDLPQDPDGGDPYAHAAETLRAWRDEGVIVRDDQPALWVLEQVTGALAGTELLIADGHHRYETARVHARETGDPGAQYVLMCLVALQDPGLTVFPTHRLLTGLDDARRAALEATLAEDFTGAPVDPADLEPHGDGDVRMGYLDG